MKWVRWQISICTFAILPNLPRDNYLISKYIQFCHAKIRRNKKKSLEFQKAMWLKLSVKNLTKMADFLIQCETDNWLCLGYSIMLFYYVPKNTFYQKIIITKKLGWTFTFYPITKKIDKELTKWRVKLNKGYEKEVLRNIKERIIYCTFCKWELTN